MAGRHPATPREVEHELIGLATDLVRERLKAGTATSQETTFFLKLGSSDSEIQKRKMEMEMELMKKKTEILDLGARIVEKIDKAEAAMKSYQPTPPEEVL